MQYLKSNYDDTKQNGSKLTVKQTIKPGKDEKNTIKLIQILSARNTYISSNDLAELLELLSFVWVEFTFCLSVLLRNVFNILFERNMFWLQIVQEFRSGINQIFIFYYVC